MPFWNEINGDTTMKSIPQSGIIVISFALTLGAAAILFSL